MNKPTKFITGMLAMALVFGMTAIGCDHGGGGGGTPTSLAGTVWEANAPGGQSGIIRLTFTATTLTQEFVSNGSSQPMGTMSYTYSGGTVTITVPASQGGGTATATVSRTTMTVPNADGQGGPLIFTKKS